MILLDTNILGMVRGLGITGIRSHDARLVAAMQTYGIERLLTFNAEHFRRFSIAVVDPASLCGGGRIR
jgi:hypothetical protein